MKFRILGVAALAAGALAFGITPAFASETTLHTVTDRGHHHTDHKPPQPREQWCTWGNQKNEDKGSWKLPDGKCNPEPRLVTCDPKPWGPRTDSRVIFASDVTRGIKCDPVPCITYPQTTGYTDPAWNRTPPRTEPCPPKVTSDPRKPCLPEVTTRSSRPCSTGNDHDSQGRPHLTGSRPCSIRHLF